MASQPSTLSQPQDILAASAYASEPSRDEAFPDDLSSAHHAGVKWRFHRQQPSTNNPFDPSSTLQERRDESRSHLSTLDTAALLRPGASPQASPGSAGLRIQTDITPVSTPVQPERNLRTPSPVSTRRPSWSNAAPIARTPSIKRVMNSAGGSVGSTPSSAISSPMLNALSDVTPLPSPLLSGDSPGPWKRLPSRPASRDRMVPIGVDSALVTTNGESISAAVLNQSKRRAYHALFNDGQPPTQMDHQRDRSLSEYVPEVVHSSKPRHVTLSGSHTPTHDTAIDGIESQMRREPHLALQRGLAAVARPPTPPSSRAGESSDSDSSFSNAHSHTLRTAKRPHYEYFEAYTRNDQKRRRWRAVKPLGQGTFSRVVLATSQTSDASSDRIDENDGMYPADGVLTPVEPDTHRKKLVAIKICEHGPKGGASEERIEMSLKRELDIMKSISHPSLVHLKAWNIEQTRAVLVLSYSPGGDLFEVASQHKNLLVPSLVRRICAELVDAIQYLHERHIVHRDIKLESMPFLFFTSLS
jgi:protein-serine/threonine kinase